MRPKLLLEAVASVHAQTPNIVPIVVVHGEERDFQDVKTRISSCNCTIFLHANEEGQPRRRGYPGNVGFDYVADKSELFDYVTLLDDDDILYPFFASRMSEVLKWSGADLIYTMSNKRWPCRPAEVGVSPLPASCLVADNFIASNGFALATEFLRRTGIRFDEHKEYLEDWKFLLSLWGSGARFHFLPEILSEFRITNDGNTITKREPEEYAAAVADVQALSEKIAITKYAGLPQFRRDMLDFGWSDIQTGKFNIRAMDLAYSCWLRAEQYRVRDADCEIRDYDNLDSPT